MGRSLGWIETFRYTLATSNLAITVPRPWAMMPSITALTETYCTVKGGLEMPSFMLYPAGEERSRMRRHFPGWLFLGMTPKQLICREANRGAEKGPATLADETSLCKWSLLQKGARRRNTCLMKQTQDWPWTTQSQYENPCVFGKAHRPMLPGLDDAAILSKIDPATVKRPGRLGLMMRKNEKKLQRWVY